MDYRQLLDSLTPDIYKRLKRAVETGRWADGRKLSAEQRQTCMRAVIAYDARHKPEQERVGFVHRRAHSPCGRNEGEQVGRDDDRQRPVRWR